MSTSTGATGRTTGSTVIRSVPRGTSFAGLVGVELRRLWWRRMTKVVLVAVVALLGVATYSAYQETNPEAVAERLADFNRAVAEQRRTISEMTEADKAAQIAQCKQEEVAAGVPSGDFLCEQMFALPDPAEFAITDTARGELARTMAIQAFYVLGFLAFLVGASFVAAEFAAGSMGNWLTFQPRRIRVGAAKLVAALLGGAVIGALGVALALLGATLVTTVNRPGEGVEVSPAPPLTGDTVTETLLRIVAVVAVGGLGGAVMGLILRSTAGVVGMVMGWTLFVESLIASGFSGGRLQPWLLRLNIESFVNKGAEYYVTVCNANSCQSTQLTNSYTHGWVYLLVIALVGVVVALILFHRRDVT